MSQREFAETARQYAAGDISRRRFITRLVAGGFTLVAAVAYADGTVSAAPRRVSSALVYGEGPGNSGLPTAPPGLGGTPPGEGGTPPPFTTPPPGLGGTPPGKGGTPPGQQRSN